ncbi:MAG: T9SS type B sorting domain-containing protein [Bacteroidia bacterium]
MLQDVTAPYINDNILTASVVNHSTIKLTFNKSDSNDVTWYFIYRAVNGGTYSKIDSIAKSGTKQIYTYTDTKVRPDTASYCYKISAVDDCKNFSSQSKPHCTVNLTGKASQSETYVALNWNHYTGFVEDTVELQQYKNKKWVAVWYGKTHDSTVNYAGLNNIEFKCGVNYFFRIVYRSKTSTQFSVSDSVKVTPFDTIAPAQVNIRSVSVKNTTSVNVIFDKVADLDVKKYEIYYKDGLSGTYSLLTTVNLPFTSPYTYTHTGINPATKTYYYQAYAIDSCGANKSKSSETHAHVQLSQTAKNLSVQLNWSRYVGFTVKDYTVQKYVSGQWKNLDTLAKNDTAYLDTALSCNVKYYYRIKAFEDGGDNVIAYSDSVVSTPYDTVRPKQVNIRSVSVKNGTTVEITFDKVADKDVKKYEIYYKEIGGTYSKVTTINTPFTSPYTYTHTGLDPVTKTYVYQVFAIDSCADNKSKSSETHKTIQLTGKEKNLSNSIAWTKYAGFSPKQYIVQKRKGSAWQILDTLTNTDTSFLDKGLACNLNYYYRILAIENGGDNAISYSDSIALKPYDTIRPAEVNIRNVSVKNGTSITITFDKVPDTDVKKYEIYYREGTGSFTKLTTINLPFTSPYTYTHTGINALTKTYSYQIYALDSCADNKSLTSETHTAIQLSGQGRNLSNFVSWSPYKGFKVKNYKVQKLVNKSWTNLADVTTDTSYLDTGLSCNVVRYYRVQAFENGGDSANSYSDTIALTPYDTIKPATTVIHYVSVNNSNTISLSWSKSASKDVKAYRLTRTSNFSTDKYIDTIRIDTFYVDTNSIDARLGSYHYQIQAMDSCAENLSALSARFSSIHVHDSIFGCEQKIHVKWIIPNTWKSGIKEFEVYRSEDGNTETFIGTAKGTDRIYTDATVNNRHLYTYRVKAIQQNGNAYTAYSNVDSIQTFIPDNPEIIYASKLTTSESTGKTEIRWKSQLGSAHIKYHDVYARENGTGSYILVGSKIPSKQDSFIHANINTKTTNYEYIIISTDSCGNLTDTASSHTTINMDMTVGQLIHDLVWTPYKGFDVDFYKVEQFLGGVWQHVETVPGTDTALLRFPSPCNTNVYYRVVAVSVDSVEALSDSAGGQAIDTIPANAPLLNNATVINGNTIQLNFRGADSLDVFGYGIMRSSDGSAFEGIDFLPINTFGENIIYDDIINTQGNAFCYTILTLDSCLNFTPSDTFCTIQLKGEALNQANQLNWHRFQGFDIDYYLEKWTGTNWQTIDTFTSKDTSLLIKPLSCDIAQTYRITGIDKSGSRITRSDTITLTPFDTLLPDAPKLHFARFLNYFMHLSWSWDTLSDVKYFEVWRSDSTQLVFKKIATVEYDSVYFDSSIPYMNHKYNYFIRAIDSCDMSHISTPSDTHTTVKMTATTLACVPLVWLNWSPYIGFGKNALQYNIYRAQPIRGDSFSLIKTVPGNQLSFTDSTVTEGIDYCYYIETVDNGSGYKSQTDEICIVPKVYPLPQNITLIRATVTKTGLANGETLLEWTALAASDIYAVGYKIYVSENGGTATLLQTIPDRNITSFTHTGINTRNNTFTYTIYPYNICDKNGSATVAHKTINLDVQNQNLLAKLQWNGYEGFTVDKYEVYKSVNGSALSLAFVVPGSQTSFTDTNIYCGKTYTYRITAFEKNGLNQFSYSDTVTIVAFDTIAPQQSDISVASIAKTSAALGEIRLYYSTSKDKNRYGYVIYRAINNGVYNVMDTVVYAFNNPLQFIDTRLNTVNNTYSYYIRSMDSCGNIAMPSDTHRAVLLDVTAKSAYNQLDWTAYIGFAKNASNPPRYIVEKFYDNAIGWVPIRTLNNGETSINDSDIHCNVLYTYRIITYDSYGEISYSNTDTARAFEHILPIVPDIKLVTVTATHHLKGQVRLTWKPSISTDAAKYLLYRKSLNNNWSLIATLPNTDSVYVDNNLNTYRSAFSYKILVIDSCANLSMDNSEIHETVNLIATAEDSRIRLNWNAYQGFKIKEYRLYKNGVLLGKFSPFELTFTDTFVKCKNTYKYSLEAISDADTFVISYSNRDSLQPFDTKAPMPVYLVSASVSKPNQEAEILWAKSLSFDAAGYRLYRKNLIAGNTELVFTSRNPNDTFYKHSTDLTADKICYFVTAYDDCDNTSAPSNNGCLIYLDGKALTDENALNWNEYEHWPKGVDHYNIYRRDDNGLQTLIATVPASDRAEIDKTLSLLTKNFCYQVEAVEVKGGYDANSFSTEICLQQQPHIFVPNAFTPGNSLNLNDVFGPQGAYFEKYEMKIFNRWGQRIYETNNSKGWDGKSRSGELFTEGVYLYKITVFGYDGTPHVKDGLVYLLW